MSALIPLATTAALGAGYWATLLAINGRRRAGEPPLVSGVIPGLGTALSFGRDAPGFVARCRERHGEVFTIYLGGQRMTFVLDPLSYAAVLKAPKLRFEPIEDEALIHGFGYPTPRGDVDITVLADYDHLYLKGEHLGPVTARMDARLRRELAAAADEDWRAVELYDLLWGLIFRAGTDALFGDGVQSPELRADFEAFDAQFPLLVGGMPAFMTRRGREARARVQARLTGVGSEGSAWMRKRAEYLAEADAHITGKLNSALLWAATANTVPAAFWTLFQLLAHDDALAAVRAELEEVLGGCGPEALAKLEVDRLDELRVLDSAVREALRLSTGVMTVRKVVESFDFEAPCGRWRLREGDRVCLFPYLLHRDPAIHPDPERYRYDRFYSERGIKRFERNGQRLPFALMPFGGGRSMCPGRYFAINEMKLLVAMILLSFEIELEDRGDPGFDLSRPGLGIFVPGRGVPARIRERSP